MWEEPFYEESVSMEIKGPECVHCKRQRRDHLYLCSDDYAIRFWFELQGVEPTPAWVKRIRKILNWLGFNVQLITDEITCPGYAPAGKQGGWDWSVLSDEENDMLLPLLEGGGFRRIS